MKTIGGFLCIRNGVDLDYCFREAIRSMLPVCDEVHVSDCESTDGTREILEAWVKREPKLSMSSYKWMDPDGDPSWWTTWLNVAREKLHTDFAIYVDGDECFHQDSYQEIINAAQNGYVLTCRRFNFWRDAQSLIPNGHCCGHEVIRVGNQRLFFPTDCPEPRAQEIKSLARPSTVFIGHYGFLREREAFFKKSRAVMRIWAGSHTYDERLVAAEKYEGNWSTMPGISGWENNLVPFTGTHPKTIHTWLTERGYKV